MPVAVPNAAEYPLNCLSAWNPLGIYETAARSHSDSLAAIEEQAIATEAPFVTVVTFFPHPQEFFSGQARSLLTPLPEKALQLSTMGVDQLVLLPFTQTLASLSPEAFVKEILIHRLQARQISVGVDFRFGHRRAGQATDLRAIASAHGIEVNIVPLKTSADGDRISSSAIRAALQIGNVQRANHLLGRSYSLTGRVVRGQQLGRTIGFPTANLKLPPEKFLPSYGVYSVWVYVPAEHSRTVLVPGVMNIGQRPTVDGMNQTIEVHLFDWSGDLYDRTLSVSLEQFIRPEQKFSSLDELKRQIERDCQVAKATLSVGDRR